jgi:hypothetical protein
MVDSTVIGDIRGTSSKHKEDQSKVRNGQVNAFGLETSSVSMKKQKSAVHNSKGKKSTNNLFLSSA